MNTRTTLLVAGMLLAAITSGFGQPTNQSPIDEAESMPGRPGLAVQHAVMNFAELARKEMLPPARVLQGEIATSPQPTGNIAGAGPDPVPPSPAAADSFSAFEDLGFRTSPDTQGAVGPTNVMAILNQGVRIQDRAGTTISTVTPTNFWASLGPFNNSTPYGPVIFDPKILYDPFENRWIAV